MIPIVVGIAAGTFAVLEVEASLDAYFGTTEYPPESVAAKQLWSFKKQLMAQWNFAALRYPKQELVALLQQLAATAQQTYASGEGLRWRLSGPWQDSTATTAAKLGSWVSTWNAMLGDASVAPADGDGLIDASAAPGLRDLVDNFVLDCRAYLSDVEYAAANDAFRLPDWAANFLNDLKAAWRAIISIFEDLADIAVALLRAIEALARAGANIAKALPALVPILVYGALGLGGVLLGYGVYRRVRAKGAR